MNFSAMIGPITDRWSSLQPKARLRFILIAAISGLVLAALLYIGLRPQYVTVFHGLSLEDASAITTELKAKKIPTRLQDAGTAIAVPQKVADQARLEAAAAGLPRSGRVGYDLFSNSSLGMTESQRKLQMQLLLEEQLTTTLLRISGIQDASIKLALPAETVFLDPKRQTAATASIWIKSASRLDGGQVAGIVHLVAHSVPNLRSEDVTVIDQDGRVLTSSSGAGPNIGDQQAMQKGLQLELERSLGTLLGQVFGEGNVVVRVAPELDYDQRTTQTVRFQAPQGGQSGLVRNLEELSEYYSGQGGTGGQPGTGTNGNGSYETPSGGESSTTSETKQRTITYELDEIRETITYAPGQIRRLSVSVIVNKADLGAQAESIRQAVQAAIGYDLSRQDVVSVQAMPFNNETEAPPVIPAASPWYETFAFKVGMGVLLAVVATLLLRSRRPSANVLVEELRPAPVAATVENAIGQHEMPLPVETEAQRLRKHLEKMAKQKPEEFAGLIKSWLNEEN